MCATPVTRLIYNPEAGGLRGGSGERRLHHALAVLEAQGFPVILVATTGPDTAGAIARDLVEQEGVDRILVAGGDGTLNEVLNGLVGSSTAVGILPAGTANVLANELGIGRWRDAVAGVSTWKPLRIPAGVVESADGSARHFLMMAGAGFDARMVYSVNTDLKRRFGKLAYWMAGLSQLGRKLEQLRVRSGDHEHCGSFCLASRVRNYGGDLEIASTIRLTDDDLEVVCFEGTVTVTYLAHLASIVAGRVDRADGITTFRAKELFLEAAGMDPVHLQVDGEHAGLLPARVTVRPDALTLLVPPLYLQNNFANAA